MDARPRKRKTAGEGKRTCAAKRTRRPGDRRPLNLSVCPDHYTRFKGLAILMDREPGELLMDWIEEKCLGMRFSLPGVGRDEGDDEAQAPKLAEGLDAA